MQEGGKEVRVMYPNRKLNEDVLIPKVGFLEASYQVSSAQSLVSAALLPTSRW